MSLTDFWNNITTPGFLSASFDELKEMCTDFKEEMTEHFEEGEELFTDGFHEMVIKDNNGYRTSINKREEGKKEIKAAQQALLEARGVTDETRSLLNVLCDEFNSLVHAVKEYENSEIESLYAELRSEFSHVTFKMPDELINFLHHVSSLIEVPDASQYEVPPAREKINTIGPVVVHTSDKQKRVKAADKFLEDVEAYKKLIESEIATQKKSGLIFDATKLSDSGISLLKKFGKLYWHMNAEEEILKPFNDLSAGGFTPKEKKRMKELLLLTASIYSIATCTAPHFSENTNLTKELIDELMGIKDMLYIGEEVSLEPIENLFLDLRDEMQGDSVC